jgi:hypothetical protein
MVLRLISRSPRRSGLFVTVVCASSRRLDAGVEASEPHDFAVRVSALVFGAARVHRIPPRVRDVRTPLCLGRDRIAIVLILPRRQGKIRKIRNLLGRRWCGMVRRVG